MAARNIAQTDTLETFRTQFNELAANDFGDIGTLDASLTATSVIGAVNEINSVVTAAAGWFIQDDATNIQAVGSGQTLSAFGTVNQVTAVVSSPDKLTLGLTDDVTIANDLTVTGDITSVGGDITVTGNIIAANVTTTGATQTLGSVQIVGNTITSTDSSWIKIDESLEVGGVVRAGYIEMNPATGYAAGMGFKSTEPTNKFIVFDGTPVINNRKIQFEGDVEDSNFMTLSCVEPTGQRFINIPDADGYMLLDVSTGYATSSIFTTSSTLNIYNSAGVLQKTIIGSAT
tara:strand:- start:5948 stop:6811 length:864 start_codon:yes stop_codon:yes gene_type:complete